jgi:chemotaxis protein methyltransferase CheR
VNGRGGTQPGRVPIADHDCTRFLQTALPRLGLRWAGLRKVRGLVCKRLGRRLRELGLAHPAAYLAHLESHPAEWERLGGFCLIPVSRFYRDRCVFERLEHEVLPVLAESAVAAGRGELAFWSACCASGEEPYTLAVLWHLRLRHRFPALRLRLVATDVDGHLLERARAGCYGVSSAKELPPDLAAKAFTRHGDELRVRDDFRAIEFLQQDIRRAVPEGAFDLVLCRNAVLTYFAPPVQLEVMGRIARTLRGGGALVTGTHESLPPGLAGLAPWPRAPAIYLRPAGP